MPNVYMWEFIVFLGIFLLCIAVFLLFTGVYAYGEKGKKTIEA